MVRMRVVSVRGGALWCSVVGREDGDLDDAREASTEEGVAEHAVDLG